MGQWHASTHWTSKVAEGNVLDVVEGCGIRWWLLTVVATVASGPIDRIDLSGDEGQLLLKWLGVQPNFGRSPKQGFGTQRQNMCS